MDFEILIPISLILVGGTLIYWIPFWMNGKHGTWILPWLFGALVAGGYLGWFYLSGAPLWGRILFVIVGCLLGGFLGMLGLISGAGVNEDPLQEYLTALFLLSMPLGVIIGTQLGNIWIIPGPAIGFCLAPLLLMLLASLTRKLFA
jgi:hypothetical protein